MRNWNSSWHPRTWAGAWFLSYLWGIETGSMTIRPNYSYSFYRTYEELKRDVGGRVSSKGSVFIVPMRNWNKVVGGRNMGRRWFLSYLWGIETSHSGIAVILIYSVFIVPMRNWNGIEIIDHIIIGDGFYRTYEELKLSKIMVTITLIDVFIVPMRNWNSHLRRSCLCRYRCFYRTYEELKQTPEA